jgi:aspartate/methionine/tyrosine aminotransferase
MWFRRMPLEDWFDAYQYQIEYDVGESAIKYLRFGELNVDLDTLPLRYGYHLGRPELRQLIAMQYDGLGADQVMVTNGASEANFIVVAALVKPGDHVIVEHPNYPSLYEVPRSLGCEVSLFRLNRSSQFQPDLSELESLITPQTKLISLTHPNNPTGSMISEDALRDAIAMAELHNVYLLFDETYRELTFGEPLPGAASLSPQVISISSMSKSYGLPGIRIGWLASRSRGILDSALEIREQVTITNGAINEAIALTALQRKDEFIQRARQHSAANLAVVRSWIAGRDDLVWVPPQAGVVALPWIVSEAVAEPEAIYQRLVDHYRTFVIPGRCFELDNHFFRLGYGGTADELQQGLERIGRALDEVHCSE